MAASSSHPSVSSGPEGSSGGDSKEDALFQHLYHGFPQDGYDYTQHLAPFGQGMYVDREVGIVGTDKPEALRRRGLAPPLRRALADRRTGWLQALERDSGDPQAAGSAVLSSTAPAEARSAPTVMAFPTLPSSATPALRWRAGSGAVAGPGTRAGDHRGRDGSAPVLSIFRPPNAPPGFPARPIVAHVSAQQPLVLVGTSAAIAAGEVSRPLPLDGAFPVLDANYQVIALPPGDQFRVVVPEILDSEIAAELDRMDLEPSLSNPLAGTGGLGDAGPRSQTGVVEAGGLEDDFVALAGGLADRDNTPTPPTTPPAVSVHHLQADSTTSDLLHGHSQTPTPGTPCGPAGRLATPALSESSPADPVSGLSQRAASACDPAPVPEPEPVQVMVRVVEVDPVTHAQRVFFRYNASAAAADRAQAAVAGAAPMHPEAQDLDRAVTELLLDTYRLDRVGALSEEPEAGPDDFPGLPDTDYWASASVSGADRVDGFGGHAGSAASERGRRV